MKRHQSQTSAEFRSKLPQELWDKISAYYEGRDWENMNRVVSDQNNEVSSLYGSETPSYKGVIAALSNSQKKFKENRIPYHDLLKEPDTHVDGKYMDAVINKISTLLLEGKTISADALLRNAIQTKVSKKPERKFHLGWLLKKVGQEVVFNILVYPYKDRIDWEKVQRAFRYLVSVYANYDGQDDFAILVDWVVHYGKVVHYGAETDEERKMYLRTLKMLVKLGTRYGFVVDDSIAPEEDLYAIGHSFE